MEWDEVTTMDAINEYIEEHIGWENVYDEMYQDMMLAMIQNRESKMRLEKRIKESDSNSIVIHP